MAYKVQEVTEYATRTIRIHLERGEPGWGAIFYIDEASGTLLVVSDWGNYQYMWGHGGRGGCTLAEFLADAGAGYLTEKLVDIRAKVNKGWVNILRTELLPALQRVLQAVPTKVEDPPSGAENAFAPP